MQTVASIDLGTTKFCLAVLRKNQQGKPTIDTLCIPAEGMTQGMLGHFETTSNALRRLITLGQEHYGFRLQHVVTGVAGEHLKSRIVKENIRIKKHIIDSLLISELSQKVETECREEGREILHVIPLSYRIDGRAEVVDPTGFSGHSLAATFFIIDADYLYLADIVRLFNSVGLSVRRLYAEPFASATVTLTEEEKELGVVLADIGGGTTDGVVFVRGMPCHLFSLNIAGLSATHDIASALRLPIEQAERAKLTFGLSVLNTRQGLDVCDIHGRSGTLTWKDVYPILAARVKELGIMLREASSLGPNLQAGLRLTGGGSAVIGIAPYLSNILQVPVKPASPTIFPVEFDFRTCGDTSDLPNILGAKYATVLGLVNLELTRIEDIQRARQHRLPSRYLSRFSNWLKDMV